ncbi:UNVERIFIED_CONTAM: hypothetical protein OHV15_18990, partial [Microbacterium sp. SLM126]
MGIKKISLGRRPATADATADAAAPRASLFGRGAGNGPARAPAERMTGWLARMPFAAQQRALTGCVVVSLLALLVSVYLDNRQ